MDTLNSLSGLLLTLSSMMSTSFNNHFVTRKLNYLGQTICGDILFATHQIAKYSSDPRKEHEETIIYLVQYLKKTRHLGLTFHPDPSKGFECCCDVDFSGNWNRDHAPIDPSTAKSRSGWIIFYANCPIIWASKLQSQVALSTTEAEYIAISMALRDVIPVMELLDEIKKELSIFKDNSGALELACLPKLRPGTKHINVCYHHFREHVRLGLIKVLPIRTDAQFAYELTNPLAQNAFCKQRHFICGA
ncbi:hypothetical protein ACHAW6_008437 [Cyclotella cf. meneghiniana]